jgi:hypothetical protein
MPNLRSIVNLVNSGIQGALNGMPFQTAKYYDIAYDRENTEKAGWIQPMVVLKTGEGIYVGPDDTFPLVVYHKITSPAYSMAKADFGDSGTFISSVYKMKLVCFGDTQKLGFFQEDIADVVAYNIPKEFSNTVLTPLEITDCVIDLGSVNLEQREVFDEEFKNIEMILKPNQFIFSFSYTVNMTYKCFSICTNN